MKKTGLFLKLFKLFSKAKTSKVLILKRNCSFADLLCDAKVCGNTQVYGNARV